MFAQWIIEKKRDGKALAEKEINSFINGFNAGSIPDYQMSALAMAIYFQGMSPAETAALTDSMLKSGRVLDRSAISGTMIDKHSTGGVGDKISLPLAPLAAACGLTVPMISGRGLGLTGGTLDKLESIPGYRSNLSEKEFFAVLRQCGCSIIGQTSELAPADKKLYALRDVTATVASIPLIVSSIISKKMAEGIDALVLDVKWGKGAFMKTLPEARELAEKMIATAKYLGRPTSALITDMNQPLGRSVGNALEVAESIEILKGHGPDDSVALTVELVARMLTLSGRVNPREKPLDLEEARDKACQKISDGSGLQKFAEMVELQGGASEIVENPEILPRAENQMALAAPQSGWVKSVDAKKIALGSLTLGAGRETVEAKIDPAVGLSDLPKIGEWIEEGEKLCTIHFNSDDKKEEALALLRDAFQIGSDKPQERPLICEIIQSD